MRQAPLRSRGRGLLWVGLCTAGRAQSAAEYTIEAFNAPPPADLADPIKAELGPAALRLKKGAQTVCGDLAPHDDSDRGARAPLGRSYPQTSGHVPARRDPGRRADEGQSGARRFRPACTSCAMASSRRTAITPARPTSSTSRCSLNAQDDRTVKGTYPTPQDMMKQSIADKSADHPIVFALMPPRQRRSRACRRTRRTSGSLKPRPATSCWPS